MKNKTFNFYCDESCHLENDRMPYFMLAYTSVAYNQVKNHKDRIKQIREKHHFYSEIKWSKVSHSKLPFYNEIVEYFFESDLKFRALIVNKQQIKNEQFNQNYDEFYYKMYYQLLNHKIDMEKQYNVYTAKFPFQRVVVRRYFQGGEKGVERSKEDAARGLLFKSDGSKRAEVEHLSQEGR